MNIVPFVCPYLPEPEEEMSHRCLTRLKDGDPADYYLAALRYGHYLWQRGIAGRAILAVTKGLYTDLPSRHAMYDRWPWPYAALKWMVSNHPGHEFPGNPRVSFQHQANRMDPVRSRVKISRAWAVWALICLARPDLPGDPTESFKVLSHDEIEALLFKHGSRDEAEVWRGCIEQSSD